MTTSNPGASAPRPEPVFDPAFTTRALLRSARRATLATLDRGAGGPYASLIATVSDADGAPLLLVSNLARHTANLGDDARASLLAADIGAGDPLAHPRVTLYGRCVAVDKDAKRGRWLTRQPESAMYYDFDDFHMLRLEPEGAHLVAGFGRIVDLGWDEIRTDVAGAEALFEAEAGVVAHMNEDHADATRLYATKLMGAQDGPWRFDGVDPLGCEISLDGRALYVPFPDRATNAGDVRRVLVALVAQARSAGD